MKESQLKELIKEEYHNVVSFMEEKYGFVPELGQVVSNPYANAFVNEATEPEIISQLKDIVAKKQNQKLKDPKSGKRMTVDLYSASAVTQVYDALKQQKNKDKFVAQGLVGMVNLAFKLLKKESVTESNIKWRDVEEGDSALVVKDNKMGLIVRAYGRKFHLKFPDGKMKTYDANDLKFYKMETVDEAAKRDYKKEYEKYGKSEKAKKYRAELNKYNRQKGTYGNGDGKDASHKGGKIVGFEDESKNRGRREKSRLKKESTLNEGLDLIEQIIFMIIVAANVYDGSISKPIIKYFKNRKEIKKIIKRVATNRDLVAAAKSKDDAKFYELLRDTLTDAEFDTLFKVGANYDKVQRGVARENMTEGVMSELDLMAREAKDFNDFLKDVFSVPAYRKHKGKKDVMDFLSKFYKDVRNESVNEGKYDDMLEDGYGHIHFVVKNLDIADELADKIEGKHLGDTDIYKDKGKSYLRVSLSVGYSGKEVSNIKKIEKIVGMKAKAGSPEIWAADDLDESVNEAYVVAYGKGPKPIKPAFAAYADKKMAQKFMDDLKKDGYKVMMTQKKIKGVDEGSQDEGFASDAQRRAAFASGYKAKGKKGKKESIEEYDVENYQDVKEFVEFMKEYKSDVNEAEYQGRDVKLGKIMQGDVKKFKVYVKNPKGNVVKVNFGHGGSSAKGKTMKIKKSNPERRKAFRARHNCDNPGPRHKARYWACRTW